MILLAGDSIACGEWDYVRSNRILTYKVVHQGMTFYLNKKGYQTKRLTRSGASNSETFIRINAYLETDVDKIIWFQSDPFGDLKPYSKEKFEIVSSDLQTFKKMKDDLIDDAYKNLNSLNKKIYCFGGTTKLDLALMKKYDNLIPVVESIPEFFYPDFEYPELFIVIAWAKFCKNKEILDYFRDCHSKRKLLITDPYKKYFLHEHPNRRAHKKLTEYLIDNFLKK